MNEKGRSLCTVPISVPSQPFNNYPLLELFLAVDIIKLSDLYEYAYNTALFP